MVSIRKGKKLAGKDLATVEVVDPQGLPQNTLSPSRQNELFVAWMQNPSVKYVVQACKVSAPTVARYRKLNNWDAMCERIGAATSEELEALLAKSLVLQFHEVIALRRRAYLEAMRGKFKDARQAFQSYTELCKLEQDLRPGAEGRGGEGDILLVVRKIYQQRRKIGDGKRVVRETAAEVLPTDAPKQVADNLPLSDDSVDNKGDA